MRTKGKKTTIEDQRVLKNPNLRMPRNCISKTKEIPRYEIRPSSLGNRIQYMKDHAIISKFIGTWSNEKDLIKWIGQWWNKKGDVGL